MNMIKVKIASCIATAAVVLSSCGGVPTEGGTEEASAPKVCSVEEVLTMVAMENNVTRTTYTKRIVGGLKKQGLKFDEDWRDDEVEAGPLPALFLRGISASIRKSDVPLGLYLGSDFPINASNKFEGKQAELFQKIKATKEPEFFYEEDVKLHTAMFADVAKAAPCVSCHNDHPQTSKKDWKLDDVMGATTWQYPSDSLTYEEAKAVITAYRNGATDIYNEMIAEIEAFKTSEKPEIGDKWPSEGFYLPTAEVFLDSVSKMIKTEETLKSFQL